MTSFTSRRIFAALLLGLTLAAPMAAASKPRTASDTRAAVIAAASWSGLLDRLWGLFSLGVHSKCGAMADPNGSCTSQPTSGGSMPSDAGASADPDG